MKEQSELKSCPFCGGNNLEEVYDDDADYFYIHCVHCEASGPRRSYALEEVPNSKWPRKTGKYAVDAWNRRSEDDAD